MNHKPNVFEVLYLDLNIKVCKITNALKIFLLHKICYTFYLLKTSLNDPKFIFKILLKVGLSEYEEFVQIFPIIFISVGY